jgi:hypothetical protein
MSKEPSCIVVVEMWRASGRQRAWRVFADEGIATEGSVDGGEETQDLSRVRGPREQWDVQHWRRWAEAGITYIAQTAIKIPGGLLRHD